MEMQAFIGTATVIAVTVIAIITRIIMATRA